MPSPTPSGLPGAGRAVWLKTLHQWHWISASLCLLGMLVFSVTGFTLNHATQIESTPQVSNRKATLPAPLHARMASSAEQHADGSAPLPPAVEGWVRTTFGIDVEGIDAEWSLEDAYVPLPRPGGDAWLRIGVDGAAEYELTSRGAVSWLNDLHKGRNTGPVWSWFIDIFAIASLVFSVTGFLILKLHAANRPATWPVVGFGIVAPVLIALLFIH